MQYTYVPNQRSKNILKIFYETAQVSLTMCYSRYNSESKNIVYPVKIEVVGSNPTGKLVSCSSVGRARTTMFTPYSLLNFFSCCMRIAFSYTRRFDIGKTDCEYGINN